MAEQPEDQQDTVDPAEPRTIGGYELIEEIGRGGMGVVYKARQISLGRLVALKALPSFIGMDAETVARFRRESEATGRLTHPGIVPVYECGEEGGIYYYAMELVEGPSLADLLAKFTIRRADRLRNPLVVETGHDVDYSASAVVPGAGPGNDYVRSCALLAAQVANALAAAHTARIVHRDVKPSNILIHKSGRPVLVDFGLARDELSHELTRGGDPIGTPSYMSPEQALGETTPDARSDVYGLGATLYELLTLRPPFDGLNGNEIMRKIIEQDVVPVRRRNPTVPVELANIVQTCLAKDPDRRYPAIEALEIDLRSFLIGRPIMAQAPGILQRLGRTIRRHRRTVGAGVIGLLMAAGIAVTAGIVEIRRSDREGAATLDAARQQLILRTDVRRAMELYGRAHELSSEPGAVAQARVAHVREAFERLYPQRLDVLEEMILTMPADEVSALGGLVEQLEGRGTIRVPPPASAEFRSLREGVLEEEWQYLFPRQQLPLGSYLVRINRSGRQSLVRTVHVRRDQEMLVDDALLPEGTLPPGMVEVVDPETRRSFSVATHELTVGAYREMLSAIEDPLLRDELTPLDWSNQEQGAASLPVRGLSFHQARTTAALMGAHLPDAREFWLAASAGLPDLRYPWGNQFDPHRIVADPNYLQGPDPVQSTAGGASPLGVLHLLGNVAELLSPTDGRPVMAGGHFQSLDPEGLQLTALHRLVTPMSGPWRRNRYAGMRLSRFLPPPEDLEAAAASRARRSEVLGNTDSSVYYDWSVAGNGALSCSLTLTGFHFEADQVKEVGLVTPGFIHSGRARAVDGHDRALQTTSLQSSTGESSDLEVEWPRAPRPGEHYRLNVTTDLLPTSGLQAEWDGFVLQVPLLASQHFSVTHCVVLPPECDVTTIEPEPTARYYENGRAHIVWELSSGSSRGSVPALVRFRTDGMLTERWPSRRRADELLRDLFGALNAADTDSLRELLHGTYLELPTGLGYTARTVDDGTGIRAALGEPTVLDVVAVGRVVTVDLKADWTIRGRDGHEATLHQWPLYVQLLRSDDRLQVLRLRPRSQPDGGQIDDQGTYQNPKLKMQIGGGDAHLTKTQDEMVEMQVMYTHPMDPNVRLQVLGHFAGDDDEDLEIETLLSSGATVLRSHELITGQPQSIIGPVDNQLEGNTTHRLFGEAGHLTREAWTFVRRGRRHFLIKAVAHGATRAEAVRRYGANRAWFAEMAATIVIE